MNIAGDALRKGTCWSKEAVVLAIHIQWQAGKAPFGQNAQVFGIQLLSTTAEVLRDKCLPKTFQFASTFVRKAARTYRWEVHLREKAQLRLETDERPALM